MKAYTVVLSLLVGFLGFLLYNRGEMEAKFIKPAGSTFFIRDKKITNTYNYTFLNKSNDKKIVTIKVIEPTHGEVIYSGSSKIVVERDKITKLRCKQNKVTLIYFTYKENLSENLIMKKLKYFLEKQ